MDAADDVGPGQDEQVVVALEVVAVIPEALAAVIGLGQAVALDHGAHGAVEDKEALGEEGGKVRRYGRAAWRSPRQGWKHRGRRKNKRRHKPGLVGLEGLRAPLIVAEPGPKGMGVAALLGRPSSLPRPPLRLPRAGPDEEGDSALALDPPGGLFHPAVGEGEMDVEMGFLGRGQAGDAPVPDLFAEIAEGGHRTGFAEEAAHRLLAHALLDAGEVGFVERLFDLADDLVGADGNHVALDAVDGWRLYSQVTEPSSLRCS